MKWAEFPLPPINLWSIPKTTYYDLMVINQQYDLMKRSKLDDEIKIREQRIKDYEFHYYTRSGRFPK